jgi:hypothetical protein
MLLAQHGAALVVNDLGGEDISVALLTTR